MRIGSSWRTVPLIALIVVLAAACGGSTSSGTSGSGGQTSRSAPSTSPTVKTATATVGGRSETILTDAKGMTLYYYTPDKGGKVTCTSACAEAWPPLVGPSGAKPTGGQGVTGSLGTAPNPGGGTVVTYNRWPLYTWVKDKAPGDTTGQGVQGVWFVATPTIPSA